MILVPILLLVGGGAGAYFMGMLDSILGIEKECIIDEDADHEESGEHGDDEDVPEECEEEEGDHEDEDDGHGDKKKKKGDKKSSDGHGGDGEEGGETAFLAIPTMIVNLNTEDGTPRYLRLTVQLELEDPSEKAEVEAIIPRVIDQFQTYLRELRVRDLRGSAGIYRLQMELLWRVNQASDPIEIKDVLFQEILIQ
ncbi:MAG: flagellar basal body protein FliL [Alphaproteobacteria bacterium]|nr:MAG: flagellar basal body protein FliL [Alphaproteobacteria bacterium]